MEQIRNLTETLKNLSGKETDSSEDLTIKVDFDSAYKFRLKFAAFIAGFLSFGFLVIAILIWQLSKEPEGLWVYLGMAGGALLIRFALRFIYSKTDSYYILNFEKMQITVIHADLFSTKKEVIDFSDIYAISINGRYETSYSPGTLWEYQACILTRNGKVINISDPVQVKIEDKEDENESYKELVELLTELASHIGVKFLPNARHGIVSGNYSISKDEDVRFSNQKQEAQASLNRTIKNTAIVSGIIFLGVILFVLISLLFE